MELNFAVVGGQTLVLECRDTGHGAETHFVEDDRVSLFDSSRSGRHWRESVSLAAITGPESEIFAVDISNSGKRTGYGIGVVDANLSVRWTGNKGDDWVEIPIATLSHDAE